MPSFNFIFMLAIGIFALSGFGNAFLINYLRKKALLDMPNNRSSHTVPTPRGGGIAVTIAMCIGMAVVAYFPDESYWVNLPLKHEIWLLLGSALALMGISLLDDIKGLSPIIRLLAHLVVAGVVIGSSNQDALYCGGLFPLWLDRIVATLLLAWFINLYNFMDGIDGITGVETILIALGLLVMAYVGSLPVIIGYWSVIVLFAALGFLFFNWHPAKIFLGDSGSVPLGLIVGWLLLKTAAEGAYFAALILPLYYLIDSGFTLIKRVIMGKKPWEAHREHLYQKAVQLGANHAQVCVFITKVNFGLVMMAIISDYSSSPQSMLAVSLIMITMMMVRMNKWGEHEPTLKEIKNNVVNEFKHTLDETTENYRIIKEKRQQQEQEDESKKSDDADN